MKVKIIKATILFLMTLAIIALTTTTTTGYETRQASQDIWTTYGVKTID